MATQTTPAAPPAQETALTPTPPQAPAPTTTAALRPVVDFDANDPIALYMNTGVFEQLQRVAKLMSSSGLVPAHLREKQADCFLVAAQAFRWRMDPFSVAQHTFVTSGKLGYEGKLIAGLINASGRLASNLKPIYSGAPGTPQRAVRIVGRIKGETDDREIDGTVSTWKTENKKWQEMPDQMLFYRGAREWARRHMPEVMLGIQAEEEVEAITVEATPIAEPGPRTLASVTERLSATTAAPAAQAKCAHADVTPADLARIPKGQVFACPTCGEAIPGTGEPTKPAAGPAQKRIE